MSRREVRINIPFRSTYRPVGPSEIFLGSSGVLNIPKFAYEVNSGWRE
jgi:hypothetical protein